VKNSKTISLTNNITCTAYEMSVGQVLSSLYLMNEFEYPAQLTEFAIANVETLLVMADDVLTFNKPMSFLKLAASEQEKVIALFFAVNNAFFKNDSEDEDDELGGRLFPETITAIDFYHNICSCVEALTRHGHAMILSYPFSFYLTVLDCFNQANRNG